MKYNITVNYESESLEDDLGKIADILMSSVDRYFKIKKEYEKQSEVSELNATVHGLDNRIDGIEAKIDDFREVITEKKKPADKEVKK